MDNPAQSTTTMASPEEPRLADAAMSLCALGRRSSSLSPDLQNDAAAASGSRDGVTAAHGGDGSTTDPASSPTAMNIELDNRLNISTPPSLPPLSASAEASANPAPSTAAVAKQLPKKGKPSSLAAKYNIKPKDPKRDTSVPFDEMKRLMRVYGSLKCLRNRTPVDSGRTAKAESIKRKFYRWFPDLEDRFVRTPEGWYRPKAGHEDEMKYREFMRKGDQESLVKKRNSRRSSGKPSVAKAV